MKQNLAFVLTEFGKQVVAEPPHSCPGALLMFNCTFIQAFIADSGRTLCNGLHNIFPRFFCQFHGAFSLQFAGTRCHVFITIFRDSKADFPRHGKATFEKWGSSN